MSPFLVGLILSLAGLAGLFWGYRIFRVILPIFGGIAGYLMAIALFPNTPILALVIGFGLAFVLVLGIYTLWSIMVTISGAILGAALGAAIAVGLGLSTWLGWVIIILVAILGGVLVWKIRDEMVIILTALTGAALVATGLRVWFGVVTIQSFLWLVIFAVLAAIGIVWQWRRYRHLELLGMGGPAEVPGATRAAPVEAVEAPVAAAPAAPAAAAVAAAGVVAASEAQEEPAMAEAEAPIVEGAPAAAAVAVMAAAEVETPVEEPVVPVPEMEAPAAMMVEASALDQLEANLDGAGLAALQEKVAFMEGIGPTYGEKLNETGIDTVIDLLRRGATRKGREELVEVTGIAAGLIMKWVNQADLFRVSGVGKQFGELLEAAGVDTVPELAQRNPVNLFTRLSEVNAEKHLAGRAPHQSEVESWVTQAKDLPRIVEY